MKNIALLVAVITLSSICRAQTKYENAAFGFESLAPADWKVYSEVRDNGRGGSVIDWGLPKVWSAADQDSIENAVVIMAYQNPALTDIGQLQQFELDRIKTILVSKEAVAAGKAPGYIANSERGKKRYKGQTRFFFENGIGYVVTFTATPETYDVNLSRFMHFVETLRFTKPTSPAGVLAVGSKLLTDRLYFAKTGSIDIAGKKTEIYNYLLFTPAGTVYTQSVTSKDPAAVGKWFGPRGRWERKGSYDVDGTKLRFTVTNEGTEDLTVEGPKTDRFAGTIFDNGKRYLDVSFDGAATRNFWFESATP